MHVKRVLFPADLSSQSDSLLCHALFQAEIRDAELHILHIITWEDADSIRFFPDPDQILMQMEASAKVQMEESLQPHKDKILKIEERTVRGSNPGRLIVEYANANDCDLIVMGCHGRKGIGHFFMGSVAEEVSRTAPCPVLTVRTTQEKMPVSPVRSVLVPVDFSNASRVALQHGKEEAALHGAHLIGVHVIQHGLFPIGPEPGIQPMIDMLPGLEASRRKLLAKWLEDEVGPGVPVQVKVETGTPYQNVVDVAKRETVDLIVMGSHGHSGFAHLVLGSTAERVIRLSPCPVLVVKGED